LTKEEFPISLKAYGKGPLQLSTDSDNKMFPFLQRLPKDIKSRKTIQTIFNSDPFSDFDSINILPLIYDEANKKCNIMVFDYEKAKEKTARILFIDKNKKFDFENNAIVSQKGRKHPIFMFLDNEGNYICEVRYGGASDNALQRGLWTHSVNAAFYFDSITDGWIDYSHNETLVKLFRLALNATCEGHVKANKILQQDIDRIKEC